MKALIRKSVFLILLDFGFLESTNINFFFKIPFVPLYDFDENNYLEKRSWYSGSPAHFPTAHTKL